MPKNIHKKIFLSLGLFLISFFAFSNISQAVDIEASASRTSGVAPLSVHFNADLTASSPMERSFHDLEYSWNFGDTNAGNWGTDNKSKNEDKGPVSAHVYETPGTFTTTLTVRNATGIIDTKTFEIIVDDPDVVFAGNKTTCISTGSDFNGCPGGAAHETISSLSDLSSYAETGERVLFRRGDNWTTISEIVWGANDGPVSIGAFGSCVSPDIQGICSNAPTITLTGTGQFINLNFLRDWRVANINITGAKTVPNAIFGGWAFYNNLIYKLKLTGFDSAITWTSYRQSDDQYMDGNAVVSCNISGSLGMVVYVGGERLAISGNIIKDSDTTHILRVWYGYMGVISHNSLSGSSLTEESGRHALKLHGPTPYGVPNGTTYAGTFAQTGEGGLRHLTQFVIVSNNIFGSSGPWPVSVGPQNDENDERLSDIIIEKNKCLASYGNSGPLAVQVGLMFEGRYITARNNILDGTGAATGYTGIDVWRRGVEWVPLGNRVYNNTIYSQDNHGSGSNGVEVHPDADLTIVQNNLVSFPNTLLQSAVANNAGSETIISNNALTDTPHFLDPSNFSPLLRNFSLTANSTQAIDQGITVPVFDDFTGQSRTGTYDIGAYDYISGEDIAAPTSPQGLNVL